MRLRPEFRRIQVRRGLTAIELLVASALAGLLSVAVLGVLGSLSAQRRELLARQTLEPWQQQLVERLRWEFANARSFQCHGKELTLVGFGGRDFNDDTPTQRPTRIAYRVEALGDRAWLVREETHLDDRALHNARRALVCADIDRLDVQSLDSAQAPAGTVPTRFRIRFYGKGGQQPLLDQAIQLY